MALLKYLKPISKFPDPTGPLSELMSPRKITECNEKVADVLDTPKTPRGKYMTFSPSERAEIGHYASVHGPSSTIKRFQTKFPGLCESTVRNLRDKYNTELKSRKRKLDFSDGENCEISELNPCKRGKKVLLGNELDSDVQTYIRSLRKSGAVINTAICIAVAEGIVRAHDEQLLSCNGGPITLKKSWAQSVLFRMNMVKRRGSCTAKIQFTDDKFSEIKDEFLQRINSVVKKHDIPPELIYNWDHTGINYVPVSSWTMEVEGTQRVPIIIGLDDKRQVTVIFAGTLSGDFLAPQVIYQGKTSACHPEYDFPLAWNITHSPNHWANTDTQMEYTSRVLVPHMDKTKKKLGLPNTQKSLCIFDVFRAQMSREFVDDLKTKNIEIVYIPPSTTDKLQPMDLSIQKVVKDKMKQRFQRWYASCISKQLDKGVDIETLKPVDLRLSILKPLGAKWLVETYKDIRSQPEMVIKGFEKAGIAEVCRKS